MQIGIFAKTFAGNDADTVLRQSAEAGYEGVQYNMACSGLASMPMTFRLLPRRRFLLQRRSGGRQSSPSPAPTT